MKPRELLALAIGAVGIVIFAGYILGQMQSARGGRALAGYTVPSRNELLAIAKTESPEPTDSPGPTDTPEPTAKPESLSESNRPQREVAQRYWSDVIGSLAMAGSAIGFAGKAIDQGDPVTAQQLLTQGEKFADAASQASLNGAPDGWDDISPNLYSAANSYKKAIGELKDALAQDDSEKTADALDDATSAGDSITQATHDARIWYEQNGGKWSDIEDYQTAERSMSASLQSLMDASSNQ